MRFLVLLLLTVLYTSAIDTELEGGGPCCCKSCLYIGGHLSVVPITGISCKEICSSGKFYFTRGKYSHQIKCTTERGSCSKPITAQKGVVLRDFIITKGLKQSTLFRPHRVVEDITCIQQGNDITVNVNYAFFNPDKMDKELYKKLVELVSEGIQTYWTRRVNLYKRRFNIKTNIIENFRSKLDLEIYDQNTNNYRRSLNPIMWDGSVYYNRGTYQSPFLENDFKEQSAHEFGHTVLYAFRGIKHSGTHKGSSSFMQEAHGLFNYPPPPKKIDIMRIYKTVRHSVKDYFKRVVVTTNDLYKLISICSRYYVK